MTGSRSSSALDELFSSPIQSTICAARTDAQAERVNVNVKTAVGVMSYE